MAAATAAAAVASMAGLVVVDDIAEASAVALAMAELRQLRVWLAETAAVRSLWSSEDPGMAKQREAPTARWVLVVARAGWAGSNTWH